MKILNATIQDSKEISRVCFLSKAYWGYSKEQLEGWREELTLTQDYILKKRVYKLQEGDKIIAFYAYYKNDNEEAMLDYLFVLPSFIGKGLGHFLMKDYLLRVEKEGFASTILHADPHATDFYLRYGFKIVGKKETSIDGRYLPIMKKAI